MKSSATLFGGVIAIIAITTYQFGAIALGIILAFLFGAFIGGLGFAYPLMKQPHLYMYWNGKNLVRETMLKPVGLRDITGSEIKPNMLVMMLANGQLLIVSNDIRDIKQTEKTLNKLQ